MLRIACLACLVAAPSMAMAEGLVVELNAIEPAETSCRISLMVENGLGADITALGVEAVLFDRSGKVLRLVTLDLQDAPKARPRLRQFDLPGLDCAGIGRVLVNAVAPCTGEGLPAPACQGALHLRSRVDGIEVIG